jgi:WhiB family transcriptional regulator, redox-sensing transcriptional regulator
VSKPTLCRSPKDLRARSFGQEHQTTLPTILGPRTHRRRGADPAGYDWLPYAACRDTATAIFFSNDPVDIAEAKLLCATCPVRELCLEEALTVPLTGRSAWVAGIWAGTDERKRGALRRQRNRKKEVA